MHNKIPRFLLILRDLIQLGLNQSVDGVQPHVHENGCSVALPDQLISKSVAPDHTVSPEAAFHAPTHHL